MSRIKTIIALIFALVLLAIPSQALAWENGGDDGNGYGTHDWVLEQAMGLSGESWVVRDTALLATDDPDKVFPATDLPNHHYNVTGSNGAAQSVADYYYLAVLAYQRGDYEEASYDLGILSHYYSDICVPFHTYYEVENDDIHLPYEWEVGSYHRSPTDAAGWVTPRSRVAVTDVRQLVIDTAAQTRSTYATFVPAYRAYGFNSTVQTITKANLSRAANGLADMIRSIARGEGVSGIGGLSVAMDKVYVAPNAYATALATCTDDGGQPVEGVRVVFTWPLASGETTTEAISGTDGVARGKVLLGNEVRMTPMTVIATATSGGQSASDSTEYIVTDVIDYIMTTFSNYAPKQGTILTARTVCLNSDGRPIPGLEVEFTWEFKTKTVTEYRVTNAYGVAQTARNIGAASLDYRVRVRGTVQAGGTTRSSSKSFLPRENTTDLSYNQVIVAGDDRYKTAAAISQKVFYDTASTVVIATGRNFPDALGGAALAGGYGAPILLTDQKTLPKAASDEIKRLGATKAIILGSTAAVDKSVETALKSAGITSITRIGGVSRYETARKIAQAVIAKAGDAYDGVAFVATGVNFPDALAASPLASARRWPIYLADPKGDASVLATQMKADGVTKAIILGGTNVVPVRYQDALEAALGDCMRLAGGDRYETGAIVARYGVSDAGLTWDGLAMATGSNFPDALAGGIFGAERGTVLLLTYGKSLSAGPAQILEEARDEMGTVNFLGGTTAISVDVRNQVSAIIEK